MGVIFMPIKEETGNKADLIKVCTGYRELRTDEVTVTQGRIGKIAQYEQEGYTTVEAMKKVMEQWKGD